MMGVKVDGLRKHPFGRVDQLEDRYLGMVEATSSNLVTSTIYSKTKFFQRFMYSMNTGLKSTFSRCLTLKGGFCG